MKELLERLARNTEWAMKQRESMVFDVHNVSQCSQLQGAPPLLKASGKADNAALSAYTDRDLQSFL